MNTSLKNFQTLVCLVTTYLAEEMPLRMAGPRLGAHSGVGWGRQILVILTALWMNTIALHLSTDGSQAAPGPDLVVQPT